MNAMTTTTTTTTTTHAFFSASRALVHGSAVYRKPSGMTVNVTRMDVEKDGKARHPADECYVGEVVRAEDGGCVQPTTLARSITPERP
jgi:hypothetical protein